MVERGPVSQEVTVQFQSGPRLGCGLHPQWGRRRQPVDDSVSSWMLLSLSPFLSEINKNKLFFKEGRREWPC